MEEQIELLTKKLEEKEQQIRELTYLYQCEKQKLNEMLEEMRRRDVEADILRETSAFVYEDIKNQKLEQELKNAYHKINKLQEELEKASSDYSVEIIGPKYEEDKGKGKEEEERTEYQEPRKLSVYSPFVYDDIKTCRIVSEIVNERVTKNIEEKITENGWTKETNDILFDWKINASKIIFIYGFILNKYKKKVENYLIYALLSSTLGTVLSGVVALILGLYQDDSVWGWLVFGLSIAMIVIDGTSLVCNGILVIKKYPEITTSLSSYKQKLNNFYAIISSQYRLPFRLRNDGDTFIKQENESRTELIQEAPDVDMKDYEEGESKFKEFSNV